MAPASAVLRCQQCPHRRSRDVSTARPCLRLRLVQHALRGRHDLAVDVDVSRPQASATYIARRPYRLIERTVRRCGESSQPTSRCKTLSAHEWRAIVLACARVGMHDCAPPATSLASSRLRGVTADGIGDRRLEFCRRRDPWIGHESANRGVVNPRPLLSLRRTLTRGARSARLSDHSPCHPMAAHSPEAPNGATEHQRQDPRRQGGG